MCVDLPMGGVNGMQDSSDSHPLCPASRWVLLHLRAERAQNMPSAAKQAFLENKEDVGHLLDFHEELSGTTGPGRREARLEVLSKSAVVLVTACWEAYVEDVAKEAFDSMLAQASSPDVFPNKVLVLAGKELHEEKNATGMWMLSGDGWRSVLKRHREQVFSSGVERFNRPISAHVDDLFLNLIGLKRVSSVWKWQGMNHENARKLLDQYVETRGRIAHRLKLDTPVHKPYAQGYLRHVELLVEKTDEGVAKHVQKCASISPW